MTSAKLRKTWHGPLILKAFEVPESRDVTCIHIVLQRALDYAPHLRLCQEILASKRNRQPAKETVQFVMGVPHYQEHKENHTQGRVIQDAQQPNDEAHEDGIFGFFRCIICSDAPLLWQVTFACCHSMEI